jgi:sugar/nucleoside kinase (ribokinase family)|tara:strand:- start:194 stop:877 length:684 start_codon:yes stop_codon:yes gene_type:complete
MHDVALYGHITFDRVFSQKGNYESVGSMGNVWKCLNKHNPEFKISLNPTAFGDAIIYSDVDKSERCSIANLNNFTKPAEVKKSKWHHVLYINELEDVSFIKDIKTGIVSADICAGKPLKDLKILNEIDYLFISDEDLFMDVKELARYVRCAVILHHSGGSLVTDGKGIVENTVKRVDNVNVLGCGDMFASFFISEYLNTQKKSEKVDLNSIIKQSHELVSQTLLDYK